MITRTAREYMEKVAAAAGLKYMKSTPSSTLKGKPRLTMSTLPGAPKPPAAPALNTSPTQTMMNNNYNNIAAKYGPKMV